MIVPARTLGRRILATLAVAAVTAGAVLLTHRTAPAFAVTPVVTTTLQGAVTEPAATWAALDMGKAAGGYNYFWQLFVRDAGSPTWRIATPSGVADNGGLVAAPVGGTSELVTAFGASQGLAYSPLAITANGAATWAPGALPGAVVLQPSALAGSATAAAFALVKTPVRAVLREGAGWTDWTTVLTQAALARTRALRACGVGQLRAVAPTGGSDPLVGATCDKEVTVPIFEHGPGGWRAVPVAGLVATAGSSTILRMANGAALVGSVRDGVRTVAVARGGAHTAWTVSTPLTLVGAARLIATGDAAAGTWFVVQQTREGESASLWSPRRGAWRTIGDLPAGTATIAVLPDGTVQALTAVGRDFGAWQRTGAGAWSEVQTVRVPILYGSSD